MVTNIQHTGGHPSIIAPTEAQCDSPYVVTRNSVPKVDIFTIAKSGEYSTNAQKTTYFV